MNPRKYYEFLFFPRNLLYTNTTIGCLSLGFADFLQQHLEALFGTKKAFVYDKKRTLCMMTGGLYFGFVGHFWYGSLERRFPGNGHGMVAKKLLCEGLIGPLYVSIPFVFVQSLEGKQFKSILERLQNNFYIICMSEWLFFLPMQAFNFYLLSPRYRVVYVSIVSVIYDTFLSFIVHKGQNDNKEKET